MTLDEFLDALSKTPRDWLLSPTSEVIRRGKRCLCPIQAVAQGGRRTYPGGWRECATRLDLPEALTVAIIDSADGCKDRLRQKLLKACGLS